MHKSVGVVFALIFFPTMAGFLAKPAFFVPRLNQIPCEANRTKEKGRTTGPAFSHTLHLRTSAATTRTAYRAICPQPVTSTGYRVTREYPLHKPTI